MRICFLPLGFNGSPAGHYRLIFPFRELEKQGHWAKTPYYHRVINPDETSDTREVIVYELDRMPEADVYVFQMEAQWKVLQVAKLLKRAGKVIVGEADDNTFNLPDWHPAHQGLNPANNPGRNWNHERCLFQLCDGMTVSTQALKESYARINPTIRVLPNYLLWELWEKVVPQYEVTRERVRIGWMGHCKLRRGDLDVLRPVVGEFLRTHPDVDFVAAGDGEVHDLLEAPDVQRVTYPSVVFPKGLAELTATMDIGLVPLALDAESRAFNESKSALKGMEYAACGIPCIASPTRVYRDWVRPGFNGFLASAPGDWAHYLHTLVTDHAFRREIGANARTLVKDEYTIDKHASKWTDFYSELIERKQRRQQPKMAVSL